MKYRAMKLKAETEKDQVLSGYAFRFDEVAEVYGGERMDPEMDIHIDPDTFLLRGHDPDKILGKVGKNLSFENRKDGLYFRVSKMPDTELGRETGELIQMGLLDGVSIGFIENKSRMEGDINVMEDIKIMEVSLVSRPAYDSGRIEDRAKLIMEKKKPYRKVNYMDKKPPELF